MVESENIKEVVNQPSVQVMVAVMMSPRDTEAGSQLSTVVSYRELQRQRYSGPILVKLAFFKTTFTSACNSSASPCFNCWHACSTVAVHSPVGGYLGTTA